MGAGVFNERHLPCAKNQSAHVAADGFLSLQNLVSVKLGSISSLLANFSIPHTFSIKGVFTDLVYVSLIATLYSHPH